MLQKKAGQVITFYSFKGGTGRSMALANVACLLAQHHIYGDKGVIMLDWDLEAPGLHRFFRDRFNKAEVKSKDLVGTIEERPGLIDLFWEMNKELEELSLSADKECITDEDEFVIKLLNKIDFKRFIIETDIPNLYIIKAGSSGDQYYSRMRSFPWESFYNRAPWLMRAFAERLSELYQYVLIDSRTGLTDISGICTKLLPEKLVLVFTPSRQSLDGVLNLGRWATNYRMESDDLRPVIIYPLPSRIEAAEPELRRIWRYGSGDEINGFQPRFEKLFEEVYEISDCNLEPYFKKIQIQHVPHYAYGEEIAVLDEECKDRFSLTESYEIFTNWLVNLSGPWEAKDSIKAEPKTLIVDQMCRTDYKTIGEAIMAANPGDEILVRPGLYQESLLVTKPLEIVGDGDRGDIVIRAADGSVITFRTTRGRISNLTLQQVGKKDCVDISMGRLDLENCDITSQGSACIGISGGADPRIRKCLIHDSRQSGVIIHNSSQGTLEDNEISSNSLTGVDIKEGSHPILRRNKIHNGKNRGVYIHEDGKGLIEENDITNNVTGVEISGGGNPFLSRNRVHDSRKDGILIQKKGKGTLEENDIYSNDYAGVRIKSGGDPLIIRNKIRDGKGAGVFILEKGHGKLEDNEIFGNTHDGIAVEEAYCSIHRNKIYRNGFHGIHIHFNSRGPDISDNDLRDNLKGAFLLPTDRSGLKLKLSNNLE